MDDIALIKAAQSGDASAFERLVEQQYDSIFRFAMSWCGNRHDAEDVAQQACVKLARGIRQFRFDAAFSTWLYRLVINCAKDWQRAQSRHPDGGQEEVDEITSTSTDRAMEASVYLQQLLAKVKSFGEEFKETLILVFGEGMSHAEAAQVLQVQESTISWRIHNVRKKLSLLENSDERG